MIRLVTASVIVVDVEFAVGLRQHHGDGCDSPRGSSYASRRGRRRPRAVCRAV